MKFDKTFLRALLGEILASAIFISIGCGGTCYFETINNLRRALCWGFAALMATQCFYCISGAHLTPCVSIAAMIVQRVNITTGLLYIVAQMIGSALGFTVVKYILPKHGGACFCCTIPGFYMKTWQVCMLEFYLTATWMFIMLAAWHPINANLLESLPIRIGLGVAGINIAGAYFSGASMNPYRSLLAAIFANSYRHIWIYIVIPPVTAVLIAVVWRFLYVAGQKPTEEDE